MPAKAVAVSPPAPPRQVADPEGLLDVVVHDDHELRWREVGNRAGAPASGWFTLSLPIDVCVGEAAGLPYDVAFKLVVDKRRSVVVDAVTVRRRPGGREVTSSAMRRLDLEPWKVRAVQLAAVGDDGAMPSDVDASAGVNADPYAPWRRPPELLSGLRMSDEVLADVAQVYRRAVELDDEPTNRVADVFAKPRSTAGRWVLEARRRGFLEPAGEPMRPANPTTPTKPRARLSDEEAVAGLEAQRRRLGW